MTGLQLNLWTWFVYFVVWTVWGFFVHRARWSEGLVRRAQYATLLWGGFAMVVHSLVYLRPHRAAVLVWLGNTMTIGGILFAAWARFELGKLWSGYVTLREGHRLIRTGPYKLARHPLYTGLLTAVLGSTLVVSTLSAAVGFVVVVCGMMIKIRREEALLIGEFGDEFRQFQRDTSMLVPFIY
jgi:protein-S-isoprenylcysteine O-methyltransferase Ste14